MILDELRLSGFRSFYDESVRIDAPLILIGENDVGKSNLLAGIVEFLDPPKKMDLASDHFGFDIGTTVVLEGRCSLEEDDELSNDLQAISVDGTLTFRRTWEGVETQSTSLISPDGEAETNRNLVKEAEGFLPHPVPVPPLRDVFSETKLGPRSEFGKTLLPIIRDVLDQVRENREELEASFRESLALRFETLSGIVREMNPRVEAIVPELRVDLQKGLNLRLLVRDEAGEVPLEAKGSGLKSALVVGLFRYYALVHGVQRYVFIVEEPEAYLYPHLQRVFFRALRKITQSGRQVAVSTHSPYFIDDMPVEELRDSVAVVRYDPREGSKVFRPGDGDLHPNDLDWIQTNVTSKNSEMLFGRSVLLVEGPTERFAIPIFAERLGILCDAEGISVFEVGGDHFDPLLKLLGAYGIPCAVLCDQSAAERVNECVRRGLLARDDRFIVDEGEFEDLYPREVRIAVQGLRKPAAGRKAAQMMPVIPPIIQAAIERIQQLARSP